MTAVAAVDNNVDDAVGVRNVDFAIAVNITGLRIVFLNDMNKIFPAILGAISSGGAFGHMQYTILLVNALKSPGAVHVAL